MKLQDFPILADENINHHVVKALSEDGRNVSTVTQEGLTGRDDAEILKLAYSQKRIVLTHDSDFGTLAIREGQPFVGVVFLRPGHISPSFVRRMLKELEDVELDPRKPFILVAERRAENMRVKLRLVETD